MKTLRDFLAVESVGPDTEHAILGMYRDSGMPVAEICAAVGTSVGTVYRVIEKYGLKPSRLGRRRRNHDLVSHYDQLGLGKRRIAELTGYSVRQVHNILRSVPEDPGHVFFELPGHPG